MAETTQSNGKSTPNPRKRASSLVNTSVEDCRDSLPFYADLDVLEAALEMSNEKGNKSRSKLIEARIKKLKRSGKLKLSHPNQLLNHQQPARNQKKVIDAAELKRLASEGKSRREISDAMKRPYGHFWATVNGTQSLITAYKQGVAEFEKTKNA